MGSTGRGRLTSSTDTVSQHDRQNEDVGGGAVRYGGDLKLQTVDLFIFCCFADLTLRSQKMFGFFELC